VSLFGLRNLLEYIFYIYKLMERIKFDHIWVLREAVKKQVYFVW